ncbi:transcription factor bHLH95-like [Senna tora]|uniref:Transcription factor bHLH95-like n=1 Tax=Senna tora TaxID=362788 RepID=A0A834SZL9_9FABA|nr:transcription factor bHLH95-like [Senna tora]
MFLVKKLSSIYVLLRIHVSSPTSASFLTSTISRFCMLISRLAIIRGSIWFKHMQKDKQKSVMVMEFARPSTKLPTFHGSDKTTIVDQAVSYIKALEQTLENLEKVNEERLKSMSTTTLGDSSSENTYSREAFMADQAANPNNSAIPINSNPLLIPNYQTSTGFEIWSSPNLVLNVFSEDAQFSMCSTKKPCLFTTICFVFYKHNIEVLSSHISSRDNQRFYMVQAHACKERLRCISCGAKIRSSSS